MKGLMLVVLLIVIMSSGKKEDDEKRSALKKEIDGLTYKDIAQRLGAAREILREHGNYGWLTEKGGFVILNNGIEFAVTYLIMLFSLFFTGGGRYTSADYYLGRLVNR